MKFEVWCPDLDQEQDDAERITAYNMEEAAKQWAENDDANSAEYSIVGGQERIVMIRDLDSRAVHKFQVSGESVAVYYAKDVSDPL